MSQPTDSPMARTGPIIRRLRRRAGLSRREVAERAKVAVEVLRTIEQSQGVPEVALPVVDAVLGALDASLRDVGLLDWQLQQGEKITVQVTEGREIESLMRTVETLQARVGSLEYELAHQDSARVRLLQVQSIKLLERTMESAGMTQEEMRRLMAEMTMEDVS